MNEYVYNYVKEESDEETADRIMKILTKYGKLTYLVEQGFLAMALIQRITRDCADTLEGICNQFKRSLDESNDIESFLFKLNSNNIIEYSQIREDVNVEILEDLSDTINYQIDGLAGAEIIDEHIMLSMEKTDELIMTDLYKFYNNLLSKHKVIEEIDTLLRKY